jgi:hypothetical protein
VLFLDVLRWSEIKIDWPVLVQVGLSSFDEIHDWPLLVHGVLSCFKLL